jgi:hypothetical protein
LAAKDSSIRWPYEPPQEENLTIKLEEVNQSFSFSAVSMDSESQSSPTGRKRKRQKKATSNETKKALRPDQTLTLDAVKAKGDVPAGIGRIQGGPRTGS